MPQRYDMVYYPPIGVNDDPSSNARLFLTLQSLLLQQLPWQIPYYPSLGKHIGQPKTDILISTVFFSHKITVLFPLLFSGLQLYHNVPGDLM